MADAHKSANLQDAPLQDALLQDAPLQGLQSAARQAQGKGPPPVHLWNPPFCGDIPMTIRRDGVWIYQGTPIGRPAMVKLFASILRRDPDRYVLVTPVEMVGIEVEDAPFLAVAMEVEDGRLGFRTNVEDEVICDAEHPLRFETGPSGGVKPYLLVRGGLWALLTRALTHDLLALGEMREMGGVEMFGVASSGTFFPIAAASDMEAPGDQREG